MSRHEEEDPKFVDPARHLTPASQAVRDEAARPVHSSRNSRRYALATVVVYALVAGAWIIFSDRLVAALVRAPEEWLYISWLKGLAFVLGTAGLLYLLLMRTIRTLNRDVVERRNAELIADRERRFAGALIEAMPGIFYLIDAAGRFLRWNNNLERVSGFSAAELARKGALDFISEEQKPLLRARIGEVFRTGESSLEAAFIARDGSSTPYFFTGKRIVFEGETCIIGVGVDISAREHVEAALRESEQRLRQLAENVDDVFWLTDLRQEKVIYVSPAYETLYGRTCEQLYLDPNDWFAGVHPEDRERLTRASEDFASGRFDETYRIVRPDGKVRWARARAFPVRDAEGEVCRVAGVVRDITEYRQLDEQLRHSQKMEAVGRLAGGVAHDFNNLLSVILSYTSILLEELEAGNPMREDISEVHRAGERATDLTRQLLAFSRQQVLQPKVLDLSAVVRGMEKMLRRLLGEDIVLSLSTAARDARVHADPSQMEQILLNLAVNARDAMPHGGTLEITLADVELEPSFASLVALEAGRYVLLEVKDTGTGMDAATRERIFEPFFTTKATGKGTGLGLSTVFGAVQQSRGQIEVQSEPGRGTAFKIYLPRTRLAADTVEAGATALDTLRGSETILLVEDDDQLREVNRTVLQRGGYTVLDARNGGEALLISEQCPGEIQLLLTDVIMPRMSGPELAERIAPLHPRMRVLYVSGYTPDSILQHGVLEPGVDFLHKPIVPEVLLRKVREVLRSDTSSFVSIRAATGTQ